MDAELLSMQLLDAGLEATFDRVESADGLASALRTGPVDLVLSDVSLPQFSGYEALEIVRAHDRLLPFVFVSGTIDEQMAVDALQGGANDYVLKHNPVRLPSAVARAIREARNERERERAEKELMRSQRLDSLAMLAAGLSHDLRNVLQPLLIVPGLMETYSEDPRIRRLGEMVAESGRRGHEMAESMLSFVRGSRAAVQEVDIGGLFAAVQLLLQGSLPRNVRLDVQMPNEVLLVEGNRTELQQSLINLGLNGIQAMREEGGTLTLSAHQREESGRQWVCLRVADQGTGMDAATQGKLFTPFFTTKPDGTGLGLLSCKRIVESRGGRIEVDSVHGKGTVFTLWFPASEVEEPVWMPHAAYREGMGEHVLVVDGDGVRALLLANSLASQGYDPVVVGDAVAALAHLRQQGVPGLALIDGAALRQSGAAILDALAQAGFDGRVLVLEREDRDGPQPESPLLFASLFMPLQMGTVFLAVEAALSGGRRG